MQQIIFIIVVKYATAKIFIQYVLIPYLIRSQSNNDESNNDESNMEIEMEYGESLSVQSDWEDDS